METGFLAAFSKKVITAIIAVGSMFYSTIDGVTPNLIITDMQFRDDYIVVSSEITNCYTEELDQILASGNEIRLHFSMELYREKAKEPDSTYLFFHAIQFSPIDKNFNIYLSEKNEFMYSLNKEESKSLFTNVFEHRFLSSGDLSGNRKYYVKITAWLDKIKLQGMEEELNLIYYWNSIKPNNITPLFTKANFQS